MTILSQALLKQAVATQAAIQAEAVASVDPRMVEYYRLLRIYLTNTNGGSEVEFNEIMFANPTGVFYESSVITFPE